ncbi:MAG TPA: sulfotransferase [Steroidobacteraceae bacterium]|nr:sulfotransferase [Steroidobacteraceae bacterium]
MNLADVRSPAWRARAAARVGKKLLGFTRITPERTPVFIVGLQRSGTTMLMDIFHLHPETEVLDEARDSRAFLDYRIRNPRTVRQIIAESHYRFPCFKIIADSHVLPSILDGLPDPRVLWMYREPGPNAASRLVKFPKGTAAIRKVCANQPGGGWFAEGVSPAVARRLRDLDYSRFADFDYACLVWWVRNQLYFEMGLGSDPRVRLLRYETLVSQPEPTMRALFDWTGMGWSQASMRFVHARSMKKANLPRLDPQVDALCTELLQRLDAEHAAQWIKVSAARKVAATSHVVGGAPGTV